MSTRRPENEATLDALLGLSHDADDSRAGDAGRDLDALRRPPRLDQARKAEAWRAIESRLAKESKDATGSGAPDTRDPGALPPIPLRTKIAARPTGWLAAAAVLLISFGAALFVVNQPAGGGELPGRVAAVSGSVTRAGVALRPGDLLRKGDEVRTGPGARLDFIVDEKNAFRLMADSRMVYKVEVGRGRLDVDSGYLAAVVRRRDGMGTVEIAAGPVLTRVTGTTLFVGAPPEANGKSGYVCICHGRIQVFDRARADGEAGHTDDSTPAFQRERKALHHYAGLFARGADGRLIEAAGDMRLHDDTMLEGMADLIDEDIDWSRY